MRAMMVLLTAVGKTTFLDSLRKYYPEAILVSEPINKWQNIPAEEEVMKEKHNVFIVVVSCFFYTVWYQYTSSSARQQLA